MNNHNLRFENPKSKRYYRVMVSQDLFKQWIVTKTWGGIGKAGGRVMHIPCLSQQDAINLIEDISKKRSRRGYIYYVLSILNQKR